MCQVRPISRQDVRSVSGRTKPQRLHVAGGGNDTLLVVKWRKGFSSCEPQGGRSMWSRNYRACIKCKSRARPMTGQGVCQQCYMRQYRADHQTHIAALKHAWYTAFVKGSERGKVAREQRHFGGLRESVLERDGYRCVRCASHGSLVVHHRDGQGRSVTNPANALDNLETLCRACHINEHRPTLTNARKASGRPWRQPLGRWAREWAHCRRCGTTAIRHAARGYCRTCIYHARKAETPTVKI